MTRRRWAVAGVAGVALLAVAGVVAYVVADGSSGEGSKKSAAAEPPSVGAHRLLKPECPPVSSVRWEYPGPARISSTRYELFAINYSCAEAGRWARQLARLTVPVRKAGQMTTIRGPAGFACEALPDQTGHAYAGGCQKDRSAFGWNWNVANSRSALVRDESGNYRARPLAGSDAQTIVKPLKKGRYQLYVQNTSGIGFLNSFTWTPPPGWTITRITKARGSTCRLDGDGTVACAGKVAPPSCLCVGDGGAVTVDLAVKVHTPSSAKNRTYGAVGAKFRIKTMTPVPYLIPGTPAAAKRQGL